MNILTNISTQSIPEYDGDLRSHMLRVPESIQACRGISIFGKRIQSIVYTTDVAIIRNCNADAVLAVYPFTPQPVITQSLLMAADVPVFCGVGGGTTTGKRSVSMAQHAEGQGAIGVVLNAPADNDTVAAVAEAIEIPTVMTVISELEDVTSRVEAGASILNVAAAKETPRVVEQIRSQYPDIAIIASGGPTDEDILATVEAGANAIVWTPPAGSALIKDMMERYRGRLDEAVPRVV